MRVRENDRKNIIKVGIFVSALTTVLMIMIMSIGKENSLFSRKVDLKARLHDVSNLKVGSYVELKGLRVGTVTGIAIISDQDVEITMSILKDHLKWIKNDTKVSVSSAGLVGDKYLELSGGSLSAPLIDPERDVLKLGPEASIEEVMNKGSSIVEVTERILLKFEKIMDKLDDGTKLKETMDSLNKSSANLVKITADLKEARLGEMTRRANKIMSRIETGPGTMNSFIYDDSLHRDLRSLLGGAERNKVIKYYIRESIKNSEKTKK